MDFLIGITTAAFALPWAMRAARILTREAETAAVPARRTVRR